MYIMSGHVKNAFMELLAASGLQVEPCWRPSVDIYRSRTGWLVKFELAGVTLSDVHVELQGSRLTVRGYRRDCSLTEGCIPYSMEIAYNRFERLIELPVAVGSETPQLECRDGILLVRVEAGREKL